jgi:hypothetical protein
MPSFNMHQLQHDVDHFDQDVNHQRQRRTRDEDLDPFAPLDRPDFRLDPSCAFDRWPSVDVWRDTFVSWKAVVLDEVLQHVVFLAPSCEDPVAEDFLVVERYIGDAEATPMHVHGFWRATLEISATESEEVLTVLPDTVFAISLI